MAPKAHACVAFPISDPAMRAALMSNNSDMVVDQGPQEERPFIGPELPPDFERCPGSEETETVKRQVIETYKLSPKPLPSKLPFPCAPHEPDWKSIGWDAFAGMNLFNSILARFIPPILSSYDNSPYRNPNRILSSREAHCLDIVEKAELDRLDSELQKISLTKDLERISDFTQGFIFRGLEMADPVKECVRVILGKEYRPTAIAVQDRRTYYIGRAVADAAGTIIGVAMTLKGVLTIAGGFIGSAGGTAISSTGAGAAVGIPVVAVSSVAISAGTAEIGAGMALMASGFGNFGSDMEKIRETEPKKVEVRSNSSYGSQIKVSDEKMYQLGRHYNKHGRGMGFSSKKEYEAGARAFIENNKSTAEIFEGEWSSSRGVQKQEVQIIVRSEGKQAIINKATGQIINFYEGVESRGLINIKQVQ